MTLVNVTRGAVLATHASCAVNGADRRRGLIGRDGLAQGEGMVFPHCRQVHSCGMRFPIDVLFLDRQGKAVACVRTMAPRRLTRVAWRARTAVELPAGTLARSGTAPGDRLLLV